MSVTIRKFRREDIENKVNWINHNENNKYLHYDLPLEINKTQEWFEKNKDRLDPYDAVIEYNNIPVGLIGLLCIDSKVKKAEFYIVIGNPEYKGKGVAKEATRLLLDYAFNQILLNKVFLYTEKDNISAQRLFESVGFKKEGLFRDDVLNNNQYADRYAYGIYKDSYLRKEYNHTFPPVVTPIQKVKTDDTENTFYIKRDDLYPYSFGGNKARKGILFFNDIDKIGVDCVVTYGSKSSNHCRVVANLAAQRGVKCVIVSSGEHDRDTSNLRIIRVLNAESIYCDVGYVSQKIDEVMADLKREGYTPYFIPGGGHGVNGTQAYVDCYNEILNQEKDMTVEFDYIFHASGTGTTQAGLICGNILNNGNKNIVGISIARTNPYGKSVVLDAVNAYLSDFRFDPIAFSEINFIDDYIGGGYGHTNNDIKKVIKNMLFYNGIPLDSTYTGKAFFGMLKYLKAHSITNKTILFIHTGGTPLFFDDIGNF